MESSAAVKLLSRGVRREDICWADLGCGTGTFTRALASLLTPKSTIFAVDKDEKSLSALAESGSPIIKTVHADFVRNPLSLPPLDGILMANSLHFVSDREIFIQRLKSMLTPVGRIVIIEYDTDTANPWVPYPISFRTLQASFGSLGLHATKTGTHPSVYNSHEMYAAVITVSL